jgi:phage/plasmid-like protein (TIGR03299 family)
MAHQVETMAFAHETPWHGLGVNVAETVTIEEMQVAAGLNWEVHKRPLRVSLGDNKDDTPFWGNAADVKDSFALMRSTDHKVFDIVGSRWQVPQPAAILKFFKEFVEAGNATLETAGSLRGGKVIWALADLKKNFKLGGSKDVIKNYLLLASPYEQGKATIARLTPTRVVCANTMAMAMSGTAQLEKRWSHATEFDPEAAAESLELVRDNVSEFERNAKLLKKLNLTDKEVMNILAPVYQPKGVTIDEEELAYPAAAAKLIELPELITPTLEKVLVAYKEAPGADPGNGWGCLQAATFYADHVARRDADSRLSSAWMGKEARRKTAVFNKLVEMAQ